MVFLRASFVLLATTLAVLASPLEQRDLATIQQDIAAVSSALASVDTDLNNLDTAGVAGLTPLGTDTDTLIADVQKATTDINSNGPLDEADSQQLFVQSVAPAAEALLDVLELFVSKHPTFEQLSTEVPGLIQQTEEGLESFAESVSDLTDALNNNSPPDVVSEAAPIRSSIAAAFATAIVTYSD